MLANKGVQLASTRHGANSFRRKNQANYSFNELQMTFLKHFHGSVDIGEVGSKTVPSLGRGDTDRNSVERRVYRR